MSFLSRSAGQNDGRTLIPKASDCYSAHAGAGTGQDDQLAFESLETHSFSSAPSVLVYSPFSSRRAAIAEEIRLLEGKRHEPGTHFQRYGRALVSGGPPEDDRTGGEIFGRNEYSH